MKQDEIRHYLELVNYYNVSLKNIWYYKGVYANEPKTYHYVNDTNNYEGISLKLNYEN